MGETTFHYSLESIKKAVNEKSIRACNQGWFSNDYPLIADLRARFIENRLAYFTWSPKEIIDYDYLGAIHFYKVFNCQSAYQEIEMYLGNELARLDKPDILPVSDIIKAESHGFDKFSFRMMKGDKKRKSKKA